MIQILPAEKMQTVAAMLANHTEPAKTPHSMNGNGQHNHRLDVPKWLTARGVAFTKKDRPTADGRTVYLLDACPFNPEHGKAGETSIMQGQDGKLSAKCMHDSCNNNGWEQFRDAIGKPDPDHYDPPFNRNGSSKSSKAGKTRPAAAIEQGTWLLCRDRNPENKGTVNRDNGDSCNMHLVNPDTQAATDKDIPKSQLATMDGKPLDAQDEIPRFIVTMMNSAQLDDLDTEPRFIVKNVVPAGQVGAEGAKSKGCKTGIATDLVISIASATKFLGEFDVPEALPVLDLCGESGASKIRRQARQICEARGLKLRDLPIFWGFDLPKLCLPFHVDALAEFIRKNKIALAVIDPLYLSLFTAETAGRSGDLYTMGATFEPLTALCRETGASILLVHHFRKNRGDDQQEPCSLEELSQAGLAEVVRWWILMERVKPYEGDGRHALWLRIGGSEGHASFWGLDIDEGLTVDSEGNQRTTKWTTTLSRVQDAKAEEKRQRENRQAKDQERRDGEYRDRLLQSIHSVPNGETERKLRTTARLNPANFDRAILTLEQEGRVEPCEIQKGNRTYPGWRPRDEF